MKPPDTHNRPLTEEEIDQAGIEAWTIVLRNAQGTLLLARRELEKRGVRLKPCEFVTIVDETCQCVYNEHCRGFGVGS